jgi:hypothetical protein
VQGARYTKEDNDSMVVLEDNDSVVVSSLMSENLTKAVLSTPAPYSIRESEDTPLR